MNVQSLLARLKSLRGNFTNVQLASMAAAFVVVVGLVVGAAWWLNAPTYRVFFSDLDPEAAGHLTTRLQSQQVPFQLSDGGRTILVPEDRIDQLRLDLAVSGLPSSGRMGFEIFDTTQFGATEFLEQVNFRRALEGEIARTIATLAEIESARVHISLAKQRLFGETDDTAKASVMLKLRSGRRLNGATVQGISALVAAAVEGLRPESVVIMDTSGHPLTSPDAGVDEPLGSAQVERQHQYEQQLAKQLVALLEPVVGTDAVRANVAARLYLDNEERLEEKFGDPVILSEDVKEQGSNGASLTQGVAGSRANLPGPVPPGSTQPTPATLAAATTTPPATGPYSRSQTTNYDHSKTTVKSVRPRGGVARLSVAVLVDDEHYVEKDKEGTSVPKTRPRTQQQMQKLHETVMAAVGLDTGRGDQLTVQNIAFSMPPTEETEKPGIFMRFVPQISLGMKLLVILLLGSAAFFFVGRPLMGRRTVEAQPVEEPVLPKQLPKTIEEIEGEIALQLDAGKVRLDRRLPVLTKRLTGLAKSEPEVAARLVRTWLLEDKK